MRASQANGSDKQQWSDEHAHQAGPQLALEQDNDRECQSEQRHQHHGHPGQHRGVVPPDADIEERQRIETHDQQAGHRDRDEDRVDGSASVLGPVHVLKMEDQGELVEHEGGADPEDDGRRGELMAGAVLCHGHHGDPGRQRQDHPEHRVVDMYPATAAAILRGDRDVVRLPPLARSGPVGRRTDVAGNGPGHEKSEDERDQAPHQWHPSRGDDIEVQGWRHA